MAERPLSPHFTVYRWAYTMTLSILHRVSGLALSLALVGFVLWLAAISLGPAAYDGLAPLLHSLPVRVLIALAIIALIYHFCNGLRHLAWDMGWGFELRQARASAVVVVIAAILGCLVCLYFLFRHAGAA
ncbi:MAG TPA: succinate dehydrogenase, cytochrome b556 subunit [Steroidobacteraceae bacterium]|nr:succinate dehydrogenase, cytochrome b556 subunit [Steroidobacteraceae bacterium]